MADYQPVTTQNYQEQKVSDLPAELRPKSGEGGAAWRARLTAAVQAKGGHVPDQKDPYWNRNLIAEWKRTNAPQQQSQPATGDGTSPKIPNAAPPPEAPKAPSQPINPVTPTNQTGGGTNVPNNPQGNAGSSTGPVQSQSTMPSILNGAGGQMGVSDQATSLIRAMKKQGINTSYALPSLYNQMGNFQGNSNLPWWFQWQK